MTFSSSSYGKSRTSSMAIGPEQVPRLHFHETGFSIENPLNGKVKRVNHHCRQLFL